MWSSSTQDTELIATSTSSGTSQNDEISVKCSSTESTIVSTIFQSSSDCNDRRLKVHNSSEELRSISKKRNEALQDVIDKWQLSNFTNCVYDNAVNVELDSIRENMLNDASITSNDFLLENEAVLMAIERKGLKQQITTWSGSLDDLTDWQESSFASKMNSFYSNNDHEDFHSSNSEFYKLIVNNDKNQESNFENNFMTTAVSAAIEQKGLSRYNV